MTWLSEHWLYLLFGSAYLAVLARHAWIGKQRVHALDDYLIAGRGLGGWVIGLSFYATFMSTNTFIGAAGKSWDVGLIWCVGGVVLVGLCCASWFLVAPRFVPLTKQYGSLTVADFLGSHYRSRAVQRSAAAIVAFSSIVYLVAIYRGSALALEGLLHLPYLWSVILVFLIVTSYTLLGGFESVVLTDALQGMLMVTGAAGMAVAVLVAGGGFSSIVASLHEQDPALVAWQGRMPLATILALSLAVGLKYLVEPRQLSRFYGLKDLAALRLGSLVAPLLILITYVALLPIGAMAHALVPAEAIDSSDEVIPYLLGTIGVFGPIFGPLFLLVLVSAAMSSIDSVLLVAASSIDHDLISPQDVGADAVQRTRIWVVVISLSSMLVAVSPMTDDIVTLTAFSGSLYGACFFPALVLGLFQRRVNVTAALASMICGAAVVIAWFGARRFGWTEIHEVYVGLTAGIGVYCLAGLLGNPLPGQDLPQKADSI